jgi:hypothetical protein
MKNLGLDPETREPTVYNTAASDRTIVLSIPWKREADVLTVLSQPTRYTAQAVEIATGRYKKIQDERATARMETEVNLRAAQTVLLTAWQKYHAEGAATRGTLVRDILTAERTLTAIEETLANKGRKVITLETDQSIIANPPMPVSQRGLSITS